MSDEIVLAKIKKNSVNEIWVVSKHYNGKALCDIREYFHPPDSPSWLPTKKGVSVPVGILNQAVDAVDSMTKQSTLAVVRELPRGKTAKIRFSICEYQKHIYGDIRTYYREGAESDEWKHGKGITLPLSKLGALAEALRLAEDEMTK